MPILSQKHSDSFIQRAWVGDERHFGQVINSCRELQADATRIATERASTVGGLSEQEWKDQKLSYGWDEELTNRTWEARLTESREEIANELRVTLKAKQKRFEREIAGSPDDVLPELDADDLVELEISLGSLYSSRISGGFGLSVVFRRDEGCSVKVVGPGNDWVLLGIQKLRYVLRPARPWYWWVRQWPVVIVATCIPVLIVLGVILSWLPKDVASSVGALAVGVALPALTYWSSKGVRSLFPAFELLRAGASARGSRTTSRTLTAAAWVGGIVIPFWLAKP
ncbi:hypothetical protein [Arthrobacter sp. efr-133-R2A-120]|uniref:hypothetical protein n=1 Tax=Arthrobacter sp. efr-133-R2A-120 TaxID=3040277 RepID=UPI0025513F36|nr:hypothetical protein [Arthrobacter sp. efr-133-R2A-120]